MPIETTVNSFTADVLNASHQQPVLVDFWAPWCGPCRMVSPILDRLATEAQGRWLLVKVNTDSEQQLATEYKIQGIPAFKLFKDGEVIAEKVGALGESDFRAWLETHVPSVERKIILEAIDARAQGDIMRAKALVQQVLEKQPTHTEALLLSAELALPEAPDRAEELLADLGDDMALADRIDAVETLARLLQLDVSAFVDSPGYKHFGAATEALRGHDYNAAAIAFIALVKTDRTFADDLGRRGCLALFRWLGEGHVVSAEHRGHLASALF